MPPSTAGETPTVTNLIIGILLPETEPLGPSVRQGALLAVENWNDQGEFCAKLVVRGAVGQWGTDGVEAARMVTDDGAQGLIAPPNGAGSHLALQVAGRTAVPVISLCSDSSVTRTGVPWMARVTPGTIDEAAQIFCGLNPGAKRWIAYVPDGRRGREITHDLTEAAQKSRVSLQSTIEVNWPLAALPIVWGKVLTNGPDGILLWLDPVPAASLLKTLRAAGFKGKLAGPGWLRCSDFENAAGSAMESLVVASSLREESTAARFERFAGAFRNHFSREPDATAAMSYDATQLLLEVLSRAKGRPAHEVFPLEFSFPGVTGILTFDVEGNRKVNLQLQQVRGAHFVCINEPAGGR